MTAPERSHLLYAQQLEAALSAHRKRLERDGGSLHPALAEWEALARFRVMAGHAGSDFDSPSDPSESVPVTTRALTLRQTGDAIGVSDSSVKRLIASGELRAVQIGGARRVLVADLDSYLAGLGDTTTSPAPRLTGVPA